MIKEGDIITIKTERPDERNARFTWVARNDEEHDRVDISAMELAYERLAGADRPHRHDRAGRRTWTTQGRGRLFPGALDAWTMHMKTFRCTLP